MSWALDAITPIDALRIPHRNFEHAKRAASAVILTQVPEEVLLIVGPTGAGKSLLADRLKPMILGAAGSCDGKYEPVVRMNAMNVGINGQFSTKDFALSQMQAIQHPFYSFEQDSWLDPKKLALLDRTSQGALRLAFRNALKQLRTKYFVIDELQELRHILGGMAAAGGFLDSLKGFAVESGVRLVVIGTYEVLQMLLTSTHLLRRETQVHLGRYRADCKDDVIAFDQILLAYSEHLRFGGSRSLRDWNEHLYTGSLGCIGLLGPWIRNALREAWIRDSKVLHLRHFEVGRKSAAELAKIEKEILEGEALISRDADAFPALSVGGAPATSKSRGRPFQRRPKRHAIGGAGEIR
jgi:energy-coupling factor transporter ATP-binding protein EcfA2